MIGLSAEAAPMPWYGLPVVADLHPVGAHAGVRYQELLAENLGGRAVSPGWSEVVAEADLYYRLYTISGRGTVISPRRADEWADVAATGALVSIEQLVAEVADRGDHTRAVFVVLQSLAGPGVEIRGGDDPGVRGGVGGFSARKMRDPSERRRGPGMEPKDPALQLGLGWRSGDEDESAGAPGLDYSAWMVMESAGEAAARLDYLWIRQSWRMSVRVGLPGPFSWVAGAESEPAAPDPATLRVGLAMEPARLPGWSIRLEQLRELEPVRAPVRLTLRFEGASRIPGRPGGTFGVPDDEPPALPSVPDRSALVMERIGVPPVSTPAPARRRR